MTSAFYGGQGDGVFTTSYSSRGMASVARVQLWDGDGRLRSTMEAPPRQHFRQVALSPDGRTLACTLGGNRTLEYPDGQTAYFTDRVVRLWDIPSGREIHVLKGHTQPVVAVRFSADGRRIVTASWDGTARVWDAYSGEELLAIRHCVFVMVSNTLTLTLTR